MTIKIFDEMTQGSDEWYEARRGLLTASEMKFIITPAKLQYAQNEKERSHLYELVAQRISGYVEPHYIGDDMLRGVADEVDAKILYKKNYAADAKEVGFITNDEWGFTLGYSPDLLIGENGQAEFKSRKQKFQVQTIIDNDMPDDFLIQVQTGLLVSKREYCDFATYSGGLPMLTLRIYPQPDIHAALLTAAETFEKKAVVMKDKYYENLKLPNARLLPTERRKPEEEIQASEQ